MLKKVITYCGNILVVLSILFIIRTITKFDLDYHIIAKTNMYKYIFIGVIMSSITIFFDAAAGKYMIGCICKVKIPIGKIYDIYSKSNLGKYMPGNVMHYVSRGVYCKKYNIDSKDMYYVTIMEILLKIVSAFIITILFIYNNINEILSAVNLNIRINGIMLLAIVILLVLFVFFIIFYKEKNVQETVYYEIKMIIPVIFYSIIFGINSIIFIKILSNIGCSNNRVIYTMGIYTMAWLVGYLTPGAPGGIGIKESIIVVSLASIYGQSTILLAALITRIINVVGDVVAYLVSIILKLFENRCKKSFGDGEEE